MNKRVTQKEVADALNVTQDSISLWEMGKRIPDTTYIVLFAKYFEVSADYLLGLEDESGAMATNAFNNAKQFNNLNNKGN